MTEPGNVFWKRCNSLFLRFSWPSDKTLYTLLNLTKIAETLLSMHRFVYYFYKTNHIYDKTDILLASNMTFEWLLSSFKINKIPPAYSASLFFYFLFSISISSDRQTDRQTDRLFCFLQSYIVIHIALQT